MHIAQMCMQFQPAPPTMDHLNRNCKICMGTLLENQSGLTHGWEDNIRSLLGLKWLTNGLNGKFVVLVTECHNFKEVFYTQCTVCIRYSH